MNEERIRILKMLEEGKISVEEADELLNTLNAAPEKEREVKKGKARFIKILVDEEGEEKVDISIPFSLAKTALKFMPKSAKDSLNEQEINLEELLNSVEGDLEETQTLVNINDGDTRVVIKVE
ncbi:MAG: hypothetical protein PWR10_343 [Halanaerobiales bacterium]|nr:hypothetical protein [Halanaerobiales bacterium]